MNKIVLVSIFANLALAGVVASSTAFACPPPMMPEQSRVMDASEIVVGRVLDAKPVETTTHNGEEVTLYALSVHVEDTLRGETGTNDLVTVYVVANADRNIDAEYDDTRRCDATEAGIYGAMPDLPATSERFIFFAKAFDGSTDELVLAMNQPNYIESADESAVDTTRREVNNYLTYGYVY